MKVNKGVGPNSIPTKILKDYKSELSKPLRDMINTSFTTGIFPSALKVAHIISVHKKGDKLDCDNYQPISLLSNISKIFEKMMHIQLTSFLNKNKVLSSFQFGFWNKHSTNHVFISLTEMISTWQWSVRVWCIYQPTESIWYCRPQNSSIWDKSLWNKRYSLWMVQKLLNKQATVYNS